MFDPFLKEEAMFRSIVKAITKRFSRGEQPVPRESPPLSASPEVNENSTREAASWVSPLPVVSASPEVNETSTPENASIPDVSPIPGSMEISSVELNGSSTPVNVSIADASSSDREDELRLRAYWKWEAAGKPKGSESRFWREAMEELRKGS